MPPEDQLELLATERENVFFDPQGQTFTVFLNDGTTMVEVYGANRQEVANDIGNLFFPETPSGIKTRY